MPETYQESGAYIRTLAGLAFDIVLSESETAEVTVTDHQIETGAQVSDHAYLNPREVELEIGQGTIESLDDPREMLDELRKVLEAREPVELYTGKTYYPAVLITSLQVNTDHTTENVLMATIRCREVTIVDTAEVDASQLKEAPKKRQKMPQKTKAATNRGSQNAQPKSEEDLGLLGKFVKGAGGTIHYRNGGQTNG